MDEHKIAGQTDAQRQLQRVLLLELSRRRRTARRPMSALAARSALDASAAATARRRPVVPAA